MVRTRTMTQDEYKKNHASFKIIYGFHSSPFGNCLLGVTDTDKAVLYLAFVDRNDEGGLADLKNNWPLSELVEDTNNETEEIIRNIFSPCAFVDDFLTVLLMGTEFQIKVWECLLTVPKATTITYEQIALSISNPKAVRAVGNAVMKNRIAYLVPCHRVVGKSGSNKYKWGTELKETIISHECQYP
ncbi:O-6-alkylguanine-DNA alkyltransferase [Nomia melanderi]|uniref:O-6-alkylguanine-DNA alkyltransferase n=1 Tax=Nomia melanderi TaxID=2448451 RepID=UPI0013043D64|nr:methylated-DNA--protein-cysteine methyltransferase [Nomia melanderi]XP_031831993.1 methylated-DNA--protein-cysteine methyltransferase [Nomia melanderi]XP_031831994.1 methylated-DNA--protein-cysteine methyltransferase [Nomia melanderi]XP_031831995.1 methylated-DNA--protein-cysteine methyltransferase [Nomia melanderi]XP_031831996.1 methylated-DNA--protein-cysteine methyltransferase [Nomia melanderi]XP_031831997.1 methylated-DNA--protein-cysteine methyltransferase [Nomia melanderi]